MSAHTEQVLAPDRRQEGALSTYFSAVRVHPVVVTLITVAAVAASAAFLLLRSPDYEATANLLVQPLPQEDQTFLELPLLRDTGDPVRTVQTAASLVESREAAGLAARRLGGDWTPTTLFDAAITVNTEGESNILAVTATADSAEESARVANEFSRAALDVRADQLRQPATALLEQLNARLRSTPGADQVTRAELSSRIDQVSSVVESGDPTLLLSQEAVPPTGASGAPAPLIVVLALVAGFMLAGGTAVMMELVNRRVRSEEEAVALYPTPVLARVPEMPGRSRRGPRGSNWFMPPAIREPFRTLAVQLEQRGRSRDVMVVTSATRGDGKTTSSINLAVTLAAMGKRVTVLDFDLRNPQVGTALRIDDGPAFRDLIDPKLDLEKLLVRPSELRTLRVLPVLLAAEEVHLAESVAWRVPDLIQQARTLADYVIVDTPPLGEVSDALNVVPVVDDILIVIRPGNTARSELAAMRELLERIGRTPEGCIIMAADEPAGRAYYGSGAGGASELVLGGAPAEEGESAESAAEPSGSGLDRPIRARAAQMAMAGSSREEIGDALQSEFGVSDPNRILDEALGDE